MNEHVDRHTVRATVVQPEQLGHRRQQLIRAEGAHEVRVRGGVHRVAQVAADALGHEQEFRCAMAEFAPDTPAEGYGAIALELTAEHDQVGPKRRDVREGIFPVVG